jgi:hypothetical protein
LAVRFMVGQCDFILFFIYFLVDSTLPTYMKVGMSWPWSPFVVGRAILTLTIRFLLKQCDSSKDIAFLAQATQFLLRHWILAWTDFTKLHFGRKLFG